MITKKLGKILFLTLIIIISNNCSANLWKRHDNLRSSQFSRCGYESCDLGKPGYLNIHLISHTHDDVGWLKTVDQYYYGALNVIQKAGVQYILDSVIQALAADPARKFTYVEMAFFTRWWAAQTLKTRQLVEELVQSGRLQFALGGWSMADEAAVHYSDAIDQLTRGHDVLYRLFGPCGIPKVAWQIDPFGHSRDHSDVFQDAGFDAVFFQRMDYREKIQRRMNKSLEVLWDTGIRMNNTGRGLFTSMFYDSYCYPKTFCFDDKCFDEPIQDDPELSGYNVDQRVEAFIDYVQLVSQSFQTNHIMVLMGCDFTYENANMNFKNMDKLLKYVNQRQYTTNSRINVLYSTPACYTKAVNEEFLKLGKIERRGGDFFPYASGPDSYWTGYFTSRPALKKYIRDASNLLTMCEQLHLFADRIPTHITYETNVNTDDLVDVLRRTLGVMQHHDAITGTEKQHVVSDYAWQLSKATKLGESLVGGAVFNLMPSLKSFVADQSVIFCNQLNISLCEGTNGLKPYVSKTGDGGVYILLYNPLGWQISTGVWLRIPILLPDRIMNSVDITLADLRSSETVKIPYQLIPITNRTMKIPEHHHQIANVNYDLLFNIPPTSLPLAPVGFSLIYFGIKDSQNMRRRNTLSKKSQISHNIDSHSDSFIGQSSTNRIQLLSNENQKNPLIISFENLQTGNKMNLTVELLYYLGQISDNQPSGAYVFLPKLGTIIQEIGKPTITVYEGSCVKEVHMEYDTWATLIVRLYNNGELEVEWTVGPIPDLSFSQSREVVIRYTLQNVSMQNSGEFYTDSAGRRLIRRVRNRRVDWNLPTEFHETQPIAGNYYPIVNRIVLKGIKLNTSDSLMGFAVYTDRAQGATSLIDGQVEIMLHRRLVRDDGYGVGEALMEQGEDGRGLVVRGTHKLRLEKLTHMEAEDPITAQMVTRPIIPLFVQAKKQAKPEQVNGWTALNIALPKHIHLLSLISWPLNRISSKSNQFNQILIRFENLMLNNTEPYELDVTRLLKGIKVKTAKELTITADQIKQDAIANRLAWPTETNTTTNYQEKVKSEGVTITVPPGTIATYLLIYETECH